LLSFGLSKTRLFTPLADSNFSLFNGENHIQIGPLTAEIFPSKVTNLSPLTSGSSDNTPWFQCGLP